MSSRAVNKPAKHGSGLALCHAAAETSAYDVNCILSLVYSLSCCLARDARSINIAVSSLISLSNIGSPSNDEE